MTTVIRLMRMHTEGAIPESEEQTNVPDLKVRTPSADADHPLQLVAVRDGFVAVNLAP